MKLGMKLWKWLFLLAAVGQAPFIHSLYQTYSVGQYLKQISLQRTQLSSPFRDLRGAFSLVGQRTAQRSRDGHCRQRCTSECRLGTADHIRREALVDSDFCPMTHPGWRQGLCEDTRRSCAFLTPRDGSYIIFSPARTRQLVAAMSPQWMPTVTARRRLYWAKGRRSER